MTNFSWAEFGILFAAGLVGDLAIMPYISQLVKSSNKPLKMPMWKLLLLAFVQTAVLLAVAIGIGLLAAHAIGLGAPYIEAAIAQNGTLPDVASMLVGAIGLGVLGGLALLVMDILFLPHLPGKLIDMARATTQWQNFTASFYGGIAEEILMRLFGFSALAWLLSRVWHTPAGVPTDAGFWLVNIGMAILFGVGHLPATKNLVGEITPILLARALLLNGVVGILFGWLFWQHGLEAAIIAHFTVDIVFHCGGTWVLHLNDRYHFVRTQPTPPTSVTA